MIERLLLTALLAACSVPVTYFFKKVVIEIGGSFSFHSTVEILRNANFYFAILSGLLGISAYLYVLSRVEISRLMPMLYGFMCVAITLLGIFVFNESVTISKIVGLALALTAISLLSI
jgi:multidrug transporter EmrE-like cation transporter